MGRGLCGRIYFAYSSFDFLVIAIWRNNASHLFCTKLFKILSDCCCSMPRIYSAQNSLKFCRIVVAPVCFLHWLFKPVSNVLVRSALGVGRIAQKYNKKANLSVDELSQALEFQRRVICWKALSGLGKRRQRRL